MGGKEEPLFPGACVGTLWHRDAGASVRHSHAGGWERELSPTLHHYPIINVSWDAAIAYTEWLSQQTGEKYRLPTEAEWEYAARAGMETDYGWGNVASHEYANYGKEECGGGLIQGTDQWEATAPVCSFAVNLFGLCDTAGKVWEWICSAYEERYNREELKCASQEENRPRVCRDDAWNDKPWRVRMPFRERGMRGVRNNHVGFRVVRESFGFPSVFLESLSKDELEIQRNALQTVQIDHDFRIKGDTWKWFHKCLQG